MAIHFTRGTLTILSYGCQNSKTLNGLLKTELGFDGYVMSD